MTIKHDCTMHTKYKLTRCVPCPQTFNAIQLHEIQITAWNLRRQWFENMNSCAKANVPPTTGTNVPILITQKSQVDNSSNQSLNILPDRDSRNKTYSSS